MRSRRARKLGTLAAATCCLLAVAPASAGASVAPSRGDRHGRGSHDLAGGSERARTAIVGGGQIAIPLAPWQVEVEAFIPAEEKVIRCGGSILDASHVLTAAHCMFNPKTSGQIAPEDIFVIAGTSNIDATKVDEPTQQVRGAAHVRVHPYFDYATGPTAPDDVAVLELSTPLTLSSAPGTTATAIGLAPAGTGLAEGSQVTLTGFGEQVANEKSDGLLYSLGMTVGYSHLCGGEADALFICASTPTGSACLGDSGSGLTAPMPAPMLLGVADIVQVISGEPCRDGAYGGFVNLAAPEIGEFIEGSESPPRAPRGGGVAIRGVVSVGHSLDCEPGSWSNSPTFAYAFIDSASGQVLQQGAASTYMLSASDVGRTILCQVQASTAGGTGVGRTPPLEAVQAAPPSTPPQSAPPSSSAPAPPATEAEGVAIAGATLAVNGNGVALVKLSCAVSTGCRGTLTLSARSVSKIMGAKKRTRTVTIGSASFSIAGDGVTVGRIKLDAPGLALLSTGHGRLEAHLVLVEAEPNPGQTQTESVRLVQQGRTRAKGRKRRRR